MRKATTIALVSLTLALSGLSILCAVAGSVEASCSLSCAASTAGYYAQEAIANYRRIEQLRLPPMVGFMMGAARAVLEGNRDDALGTIRAFMSRPFDPEGCYFMARNLVRLKEHASALDLLERIVKEGFFVYQILQRDPWLDPIRAERRFNAIVASARERSQDAEAEFHRLGGDQLLA